MKSKKEESISVVPSKLAIRLTRWMAVLAMIFCFVILYEDISTGILKLGKQEAYYSLVACFCPFAAIYVWKFGSKMKAFYFRIQGDDYSYYWATGNLKNIIFGKQIIEERTGKISELKIGSIRKRKPIYIAVNGSRYFKIDSYAENIGEIAKILKKDESDAGR